MRGKIFVVVFVVLTLAIALFFGMRMQQSFTTAPPPERITR